MPHYVGLDVSQKTTAICVVDEKGKRLWRGVCTTGPEPISDRISKHAGIDAKVGIETGAMTPWLVRGAAQRRPRCSMSGCQEGESRSPDAAQQDR